MPTTTTLPNGQVLTSSALTSGEISILFQQLTAQMLGLNPSGPNDAAYSQVLIDWPTQGQPWPGGVGQDICALRCVQVDDPYDKTRDFLIQPLDGYDVQQMVGYTRCWKASWTFYGPSSFDHARIVKDFLFLDWAHDQLKASNLYLVTNAGSPRRAPELFQGQWWERTDLEARFYEEVTSTITLGAILNVPIDITTPGNATFEFMTSNASVSTMALTNSAVLVPPQIPDGTNVLISQTIIIPGAIAGHPVAVGVVPSLPYGVTASGEVTASNTVTITITNLSGQTQSPGPATYMVAVF